MPSTRTTSEPQRSATEPADADHQGDALADPAGSGANCSRHACSWEYVGATLAALWVSRQLWLPGHYPSAFDTVAYSGPNLRVTVDAWRHGNLPLWNDAIFGGVPHLGNPQAGALYPPKLLALVTDPNRAIGLLVTLHLIVLAVGTVALVRQLGCRPPSGIAAAAIITANGAVITRSTQFEQILVLAWAPLLLLGITVLSSGTREHPPWRAIAGTAFVIAMVLLAGHPQITYQLVLLGGVWTVMLAVRHRSFRRLAHLGTAIVIGAMIAAPQLVATAAASRDAVLSIRRDQVRLRSTALSAQPNHLLEVLWGSMRSVDEAMFAGGFESIAHVGMAATVLALVGLAALSVRGDRHIAVGLGLLVFLGVVWALGPRTPIFDVAFDHVPGFDAARVSARWFDVAVVAVAIAAAFGVDAIARNTVRSRHVVFAEVVIGASMLAGFALSVLLPDRLTLASWLAIAIVVTAAIRTHRSWAKPSSATVVIVAILLIELAALARASMIDEIATTTSFDDVSPGPAAELADVDGLALAFTPDGFGDPALIVRGMRPNANVLIGVRSLDGYDGGFQITERWVAMIERVSLDPQIDLPLRNSVRIPFTPGLAADLSVRWLLMENTRDPQALIPGWVRTEIGDAEFSVWENPVWRGAATASAGDDVRALTVVRSRPERTTVELSGTSPVPELVTVDQQFDRDWVARVDGRRVDTFAVDHFFLGVEVPAGATTLELTYSPSWLPPSLALTVTGSVALLLLCFIGRGGRVGGARDSADSSASDSVPIGEA